MDRGGGIQWFEAEYGIISLCENESLWWYRFYSIDKTMAFYAKTYYKSLLFSGYNLVFQCWKCIKGCIHIQISHCHLFLYTEAHGPQALHRVGTPKLAPTLQLQDRYSSSARTPAPGKSCAETGTRPNGLHQSYSFSFAFSLSSISSACLCLTIVF